MSINKFIKASKKLDFIRKMPPLKNREKEEKYDPNKSEVIDWILKHKEAGEYIFEIVNGKDKRREKLIKYDSENGMWVGVDYEGE